MLVRETIYQNRMDFHKQVKFLWWKWWVKFAEGGSINFDGKNATKANKGELKEIRYLYY